MLNDLSDNMRLPELREELCIDRSSPLFDGAPSWSIFDPLRHLYFQIGQSELTLLALWKGGTVGELRSSFKERYGVEPEPGTIKALLHFLAANSLTRVPLGDAVTSLSKRVQQQKWWQWLLHHYLFVRLPLVRPDSFLRRTAPWVAFLFTPAFGFFIITLGVLGLYFVSRQWDDFIHTFPYFFSLDGLLIYGLSLAFTKTLHELGHAYAATRYGCRVPTMGVAFLVMMPMLYTDTTDTWKLRSRRQRMIVDGAGVLAELCLACVATFLWAFLPDGALRSAAFVIGTTSWITTLLINLSPFMRFDGYYFVSDMIGMPNLGARSQAFGQWKLRECLFDLNHPLPEPMSRRNARLLILFAWATWVYRLFLFLGIALLVYHFFFKALGLILFAVEIVWFVVMPIWREIKQWWVIRKRILEQRRSFLSFGLFILFLLACFLPLDHHVSIPAVFGATRDEPIYAPEAAQITEIRAHAGDAVRQGQILYVLNSPLLEQQERESRIRLALLQTRLSRAVADRIDRSQMQELLRSVSAEQENLEGFSKRRQLLQIKAPFDGMLSDVGLELHASRWITGKQQLARVIDKAGAQDLRGYVENQHMWRIEKGAHGSFVADDPRHPSFEVTLLEVSSVAAEEIDLPYLQSIHGGQIAVNVTDQGKAIPEQSQNAVLMRPINLAQSVQYLSQISRGVITLEAKGESVFAKVSRQVMRVLAREQGV